jgi:hypothetical protein
MDLPQFMICPMAYVLYMKPDVVESFVTRLFALSRRQARTPACSPGEERGALKPQ